MIITGTRVRGGRYYGGTASVTDTYFNLVSLLLPGNGTNGAQNNTFLDSSTNAYTITRNGNTTQGTFSPFSQTGWSVYFGGTNYLTSSYNIAFAPGSGDFTVECFVYFTASPTGTDQGFVGNINMSTGDGDWLLFWRGGASRWEFSATSNGSVGTIQRSFNTTTPTTGQWYHVVGVKNGSTLSCYVDGVKGTDGTLATVNNGSLTLNIGQGASNTGRLTGNISNLRITKGGALYSGSTFTPPTAPLTTTVSAGTVSLLTCQSNRFIDNSTNAFALVTSGAAVQAFSPFDPTAAYSTTTVGGSGYFDGTGDRLLWPGTTLAGDFTVECWVYKTAVDASGYTNVFSASGIGLNNQFAIDQTTAGSISLDIGGGGGQEIPPSGTAVTLNAWHHLAWVREGTTVRAYVDGVQQGSGTSSSSFSIGCLGSYNPDDGGAYEMNGYISSARVTNACLYPSGTTFTPSTTPFTTSVTSGTVQLLVNFTNGGITDAAAKNNVETVGNAQISTTQSKWGGSAMAFDGTGDYLTIPNNVLFALGTGDFTIECWAYLAAGSNNGLWQLASSAFPGVAGLAVSLVSGQWNIYYQNGSQIYGFGTVTTGAWYHVALVRQSGSLYIYSNGVKYTVASDTTNYTGTTLVIGGYFSTSQLWNGYINDFRITRGYARYTSNFTPPTQAFPLL